MIDGRARLRRSSIILPPWPCIIIVVVVVINASRRPAAAASSGNHPEGPLLGPTSSTSSSFDARRKTIKTAETGPTICAPTNGDDGGVGGGGKYGAAAAAAVKTIDSLGMSMSVSSSSSKKSSKSRVRHAAFASASAAAAPHPSESALMDGETNAIYWQEDADVFSASVTRPYLARWGALHVRATMLTALLWLWAWGRVSRYLACRYFESSSMSSTTTPLFASSDASPSPLATTRGFGSIVFASVLRFFSLLLHSLLYLRPPRYSPRVLFATIVLYLLESYTCSTRRYLSHAMDAPAEVESYLERMREIEPRVLWKVRCFHYEEREFWKGWRGMWKAWEEGRSTTTKRLRDDGREERAGDGTYGGGESSERPAPSSSSEAFAEPQFPWMARKVVTHQAVGAYKFGRWEDHTLASTWTRAPSFSSDSEEAPFGKVTLSKLLILKDRNTREDYFAQQAAFVTLEGRKDVRAEFATTIEVEGFRPKLLAVRPVRRGSKKISAALFRQHVYALFTLLGLSLPYRIWFASHCDEIRVTVVKETSIEEGSAKGTGTTEKSRWFPSIWGWGSSSSSATLRAQELFRKSMRELSLYDEEKDESTTTMQAANLAEGFRNEAPADQASTSPESTGPDDTNVAPTDSQPASSLSTQPSLESPTSPSQDVR